MSDGWVSGSSAQPIVVSSKMNMKQDSISLRMDRFVQTLAKIAELKKQEQWDQVIQVISIQIGRLVKTTPEEFPKLTEIGLLAQLIKGAHTFWVPYKKMMLITLLKETGDFATMKNPPRGGYGWYLRALHLLLDVLAHGEIQQQYAEIVPTVESLLSAMPGFSLPVRTRLLLMHEHERRGQFGRLKDEFLAALEKSTNKSKLLDFGLSFFNRLSGESDGTLAAAGLPRYEIEGILSKLVTEKKLLSLFPHG